MLGAEGCERGRRQDRAEGDETRERSVGDEGAPARDETEKEEEEAGELNPKDVS